MFHLSGCLGRGGRLPIVPDFNLCDSEEQTALELALCTGQMSVASRLLDAGANIEVQTTSGLTLLHKTIRRGDNAAALFLLENGADINNRYSPAPSYPSACIASNPSSASSLLFLLLRHICMLVWVHNTTSQHYHVTFLAERCRGHTLEPKACISNAKKMTPETF